MENTFFGIINENEFQKLDTKDKENYLIKNNILEANLVIQFEGTLEKTGIGESRLRFPLQPKREVSISSIAINNYYQFLIEIYTPIIEGEFIMFRRDYEKDNFAIENDKKRKYALKIFNNKFEKVCKKGYDVMIIENNQYTLKNHFSSLDKERNDLKAKLTEDPTHIMPFLYGRKEFYNHDFIQQNDLIKLIITFESTLKILTWINLEFKFTEDNYFDEDRLKIRELSDRLNNQVPFRVIQFIHKCITDIEVDKYAHVTSLFIAIKTLNLAKIKEVDFRKAINELYGFNLSRLKKPSFSYSSNERIDSFIKKWEKFKS
ncbi:hypothetical protein [Neptunitalea lumnitzerae]|uniref:Uncharacterized protein n=1 Tax=Neptunitalea lumnitzerae TaxID=2965509 RepID=A0ABQ5MF80_9FLAO|nr:hypothetical protein [Neptunitalea sp. Y10]GLB47690.1 hypothetical protein Y10_00580 [Neptunitalea sp. Y10]